jgi:hypothetical protein
LLKKYIQWGVGRVAVCLSNIGRTVPKGYWFTAAGKLKKFLATTDVSTMGDPAHIDTIFKFLPHKRQHGRIDFLHCCNDQYLRGHVAMVGLTQYIPPLPRDLTDLKARIIAAVKNIDAPILTRVWQELKCRIDVYRATRGRTFLV